MTETMPVKIAAAISTVMKDVPMLKKTEKNTHGNYNFASIDDFLEALRPLCAKAGLVILQDEEEFKADEGWLSMRFRFTLMHESGEVYDGGCRSILVNAKMGSQAFGAAQSYCLKQYMRSLFMVSTGEKNQDIDETAATNLPKAKGSAVRRAVTEPPPPMRTPQSDGMTKTALQDRARALVSELGECTDTGMLAGLWKDKDTQVALKQMETTVPDFYQSVLDAKDMAKERCDEEDERRAIQGEPLNPLAAG